MDYRNNVFTFATFSEAQEFVNYVCLILAKYERITLADLYDYAYRADRNYLENKVVWLKETLLSPENMIRPRYDELKYWWYVKFPEPDQYPASAWCNTCNCKQTPTPEPLNITIDLTNITRAQVSDLIQQANEIKDRPVFITII